MRSLKLLGAETHFVCGRRALLAGVIGVGVTGLGCGGSAQPAAFGPVPAGSASELSATFLSPTLTFHGYSLLMW